MLSGALLIICGLGLLASIRPLARETTAAQRALMPGWPEMARLASRANFVVGTAIGGAAVLAGALLLVLELAG